MEEKPKRKRRKEVEPKEHSLGIVLMHLVTGEDIVTEAVLKEDFYICTNPMKSEIDQYGTTEHAALYFSPLVPMFTGETVVIPDSKVVYMIKPNHLLISFYQEYVVDVIQKNYAAIATAARSLQKQWDLNKKTLN